MKKSELIASLAMRKSITLKKAEEVIDTIFGSMAEALMSGDKIEIRGFGSLVVKDYEGYTGRNPKTGEIVYVKAKRRPHFKAGKELREKVSG